MKILNPAVKDDLQAGKGLRLNLGSYWLPGFYTVYHLASPDIDIQADLNEPLSEIPDNSVAEIYSRHSLGHLSCFQELLEELHRVMQPEGWIELIVPHFTNPDFKSASTQGHLFGLKTFLNSDESGYRHLRIIPRFSLHEQFQVESAKCKLRGKSLLDKLAGFFLQPIINWNQNWLDRYERRLGRWMPAKEIRLILKPKKETPGTKGLEFRSAA